MVKLIRNLIIIFLFLMAGGVVSFFWKLEHRLPSVSYTEFLSTLEQGEVASIHIKGNEISFTDTYNRSFSTFAPDVANLMTKLEGEKAVNITAESDRPSLVLNSLISAIPVVLVLLMLPFFMRKQVQNTEESEFAAGKAVKFTGGGSMVTFNDVAGIGEAKTELIEIIEFLKDPRKFGRLGARIPKGVLLQGPPGTGKTLLARAIAGEAGVPFYSFSGSDFVEMFVGVGASRVRDLFKEAKRNAPCIVFIDEIDAVGASRVAAGTIGGQDERGQTLNALLVEMDGFGTEDTIVVLAATNRPDILDPALLRPGRFDRQITILSPDVKGRHQILRVHAGKVALADNVDLGEVARSTPGFTGADLANLVNEAALMAARAGKSAIDLGDFEAAKDRILMGVERKGLVISEKDRRTMAYHEAGHAIVARFLPETDPLHKITIIPRGKAMGYTQQLPLDDRHAYSKEYLLNRIKILLGGRAAEEICLNQQTTGAQDDLLRATEIAIKMVCEWGMNHVVGPLAYATEAGGFLGGEVKEGIHSEETARHIDREVRKIIEHCYEEAYSIIKQEKFFLENLAELLLINETLDREELEIIFECSQKKLEEQGEETFHKHECDTCPSAEYCAMKPKES